MEQNPQRVWAIHKVLVWSQRHLEASGVPNARLDAELLLCDALGVDRAYLHTHDDRQLTGEERQAAGALVQRRAAREPVAYILGRREFYSRMYRVTPSVMIPRPETEHLVDAALGWASTRGKGSLQILDVGTGSGAIAVTLASELPQAVVTATDVSKDALQVATANAAVHGVEKRIHFLPGDLFAPVAGKRFDIVVANPPYVDITVRGTLDPEVRDYEPAQALFAEERGLAVIRRLVSGVADHLAKPGLFACEVGYDQGDAVAAMMQAAGRWERVDLIRDLQGHRRVVVAEQ